MSRFAKLFFTLLTVAAIFGLVMRAQDVIRQDPLSRFLAPNSTIGIQLEGVTMRHYTKANLTGTAEISTIDVRQDHQYFDFHGVRNGLFKTSKGPIKFSGDSANFDAITGQLSVSAGGHVRTKDLDAICPAFLYDQNTSTLSAPGNVEGTFMGGKLIAANLVYRGSENSYSIRKVDWTGSLSVSDSGNLLQIPDSPKPPPLGSQTESKKGELQGPIGGNQPAGSQADQSGRSKWHISGGLEAANGTDFYTDMRADDGDILVKAPHGERDEKTDVLTLTGPVYYFSAKANLVCDKAVIYRKEKRAVLTGNVHMLVKPKDQEKLDVSEIPPFNPPVPAAVAQGRPAAPSSPEQQQQQDLDDELTSSKTARKYPAHIHSDEIEYWYAKGSRHAIITGSPQCYQEFPGNRWRRVATHEAFYDGEKDELTLKSSDGKNDTRLLDSIGDDLVAKQFVVSTKDDEQDRYSGTDVDGVYATNDQDVSDLKNGGQDSATSKGKSTPSGPIPASPGTPKSPVPTPPGNPPTPTPTPPPTPTTPTGH